MRAALRKPESDQARSAHWWLKSSPAAYAVEPDLGISCDTTLCCDTPGVPKEQRVTVQGDGVCLKVMDGSTIADIRLLEDIEKIAAKKKIKCQRGVLPRGGQDGAVIQRSRAGVRTAVFACPVKYIHTVTETSACWTGRPVRGSMTWP